MNLGQILYLAKLSDVCFVSSQSITSCPIRPPFLFFYYYLQMLPVIVEGIRILPLVTFPLVYFAGGDEKWVVIGVTIFWVMLLTLVVISVLKTGDENPGCMERVTR